MKNVFKEFLLNGGLYEKQCINEENISDLIELMSGSIKLECYCKECRKNHVFFCVPPVYYWRNEEDPNSKWHQSSLSEELKSLQSTYHMQNMPIPCCQSDEKTEWYWKNWQIEESVRILIFKFNCSMNENHHLDYIVLTNNHEMMKIGQYPSVADLSFPELNQYQKVLPKEDMREFRKAIGLYAQEIGVGSYVYLRRIIERLINEVSTEAINDGKITSEDYTKNKVQDRIKMLSGYLPELLVKNGVIYGIISKGIHELTEEQCISFFPVLRDAIIMILEQREEKRKKKLIEQNLSKSLSSIASTIK